MIRFTKALLIVLSLGLFCTALPAQERKISYYNQHPTELLPDARAAFKKAAYERTIELCEWYYIIVGDSSADGLKDKATRCSRLTTEIKALEASGDMTEVAKKAKDLLALNPDDSYARSVTQRASSSSSTSAAIPAGMTGDAAKYYPDAMKGDAAAQSYLGYCYYFGNGVNQSYTEAVKWYQKAADQGNAVAQFALGLCYDNGNGVNQSYTEAVKWYQRAADQGNASAQNSLGYCYDQGNGVDQSYVEAVKWYRKAANQGDRYAQRNLGLCYEYGKGVAVDYAEARKWYKNALANGNTDAQADLDRIAGNGYN